MQYRRRSSLATDTDITLAQIASVFTVDDLTEIVSTLGETAQRLYEGFGETARYKRLRTLEAAFALVLGKGLEVQAQAAVHQFQSFRSTGRVGDIPVGSHHAHAKVMRDLAISWSNVPDNWKQEVRQAFFVDDSNPAEVRISLAGPPKEA